MSKRPNPHPSERVARPKPLGGVVIATPHPGEFSAFYTSSLLGSCLRDRATSQRVVGWENEWSSANVSQSRNTLVRRFLAREDNAEWLLFVDADMQWESDAIDRLLAVADPERSPIVGGLCFGMTNGDLWPTIYQLAKDDEGRPVTYRVTDYPPNTMLQVAATGCAFLIIHRSVLVSMAEKVFNVAFPWFQETEIAGNPCGEDLTFCLRAGLLGFPVFVHTGLHIGHHKSHLLTEPLFMSQRAVTDDGTESRADN